MLEHKKYKKYKSTKNEHQVWTLLFALVIFRDGTWLESVYIIFFCNSAQKIYTSHFMN